MDAVRIVPVFFPYFFRTANRLTVNRLKTTAEEVRDFLCYDIAPVSTQVCSMDSLRTASTVRFDRYLVDFRSGELRKNGTRIRLQEKPLRVLAALMEHPGELVTREELHQRLWPDATIVDFEDGLNTAVKKLRVALCDDADESRYIETIPRRGYRFLAPVEIVASPRGYETSTSAADSTLSPPPLEAIEPPSQSLPLSNLAESNRAGSNQGSTRVAIAALLLLVLTALWWLKPLPEPTMQEIYPVTDTARQDYLVRPATDGPRIFYAQRSGDHYDLMQSSVNGGDAQLMAAPFRNTLIWDVSPDGSHFLITSFARRGEPSQLWSWPVTGGSPVKLDDMISGSATYSPDGKRIAFHIDKELWLGNADGSGKRRLGTFPGDVDDPAWSPGGDRLRFTLKDAERNTSSIWEVRLDGSGAHSILTDWTNPSQVCCGTWTPDGRYFIFLETNERPRLWALRETGSWWRRSPSGPFLLASQAEGSWSPIVGRDGKHLYFYSNVLHTDLETLDASSGQFTALLPGLHALMPVFSRDSQWVAYIRETSHALWRSRVDGTEARELPFPGTRPTFPRWSPDGKTLAFSAQAGGSQSNVYVIDAEGGRPQLLVPDQGGLRDADWSGDGSMLVVGVDHPAAGGNEASSALAMVGWKDRKLREIPGSEGKGLARWSPDGRWIAAVSDGNSQVYLYDVAGNRWRTLVQGKAIGFPVWSADSAYLYYQGSTEPGELLHRVNLSSGAVETVANFQKIIDTGVSRCVFIALTPDGHPIIDFDRAADIYGATLSLP